MYDPQYNIFISNIDVLNSAEGFLRENHSANSLQNNRFRDKENVEAKLKGAVRLFFQRHLTKSFWEFWKHRRINL